ncbi:hypothetical protein [Halostella pelagica]|uniref:hypothetical protein n=1 Tax=Halostella pelagica TaxID=2583824 RepID=UPI00108031D0|nr:hypothetical protein [Halostella pelagica]
MTDANETVEVDITTARVALRELDRVIDRTGGPEMGADEACTPLAAVRERIVECDDLDDHARGFALGAIDKVAGERDIDVSGSDPLTDATFQAKRGLADALDGDSMTDAEVSAGGTDHSFEVGDELEKVDSSVWEITNRMADGDTDETLYRLRESDVGQSNFAEILTESQIERSFHTGTDQDGDTDA